MKDLRRLRNFAISRQQLRWLFVIVVLFAACYLVLASVVASTFFREIAYASQEFDIQPVFIQRLYKVMQNAILALSLASVVLTVIVAFVMMVITHRFFGPLVAIKRFVGQVRDGNYSARLSLRDSDQLHDLAQELNAMAIELERRHEK